MSIKELIAVLRKRFWLIFTTGLLVSITVSLAFFYIVKPSYEASEFLLVGDLQTTKDVSSYEEIQKIPQLVASSVDFIQSPVVLAAVENEMGLDRSTLEKTLAVENKKDSQLITITVVDKDPQQAKEIANVLAATAIQKMNDVMKFSQVKLLEKNNHVSEKSNVLLHYSIAVLMGFLAAVGLALLVEQFDDSVKSEAKVEELLGAPVIGIFKQQERKRRPKKTASMRKRGEVYVQGE